MGVHSKTDTKGLQGGGTIVVNEVAVGGFSP